MTPTGHALRYRPGQFAFAGFEGGELHPFTFSKVPGNDGSIRMCSEILACRRRVSTPISKMPCP